RACGVLRRSALGRRPIPIVARVPPLVPSSYAGLAVTAWSWTPYPPQAPAEEGAENEPDLVIVVACGSCGQAYNVRHALTMSRATPVGLRGSGRWPQAINELARLARDAQPAFEATLTHMRTRFPGHDGGSAAEDRGVDRQ